MQPETDNLIDDDEMFVMSFDTTKNEVPEDVARARGDMPDEDTLEKPADVVLDEDKEDDEPLVETDEENDPVEDEPAAVEEEIETEETEPEAIEEEDPEPDTPKHVPYGRFSEKIAENAALKARLAELEAAKNADVPAQQEQPQFDLAGKYKEYADLIADGETGEAAKVMIEIDSFKEQQAENKILQTMARREDRNVAQQVVNEMLDTHGDWFADADNMAAFSGTRDSLIRSGRYTFSQALSKAKEMFFGKMEAKDPIPDTKADTVKAERQKKTLETNAKAAKQQPAAMTSGRSNRSGPKEKGNALAYSSKEYNALSLAEKRKNRGDIL